MLPPQPCFPLALDSLDGHTAYFLPLAMGRSPSAEPVPSSSRRCARMIYRERPGLERVGDAVAQELCAGRRQ